MSTYRWFLQACLALLPAAVMAGSIEVTVLDEGGEPVKDAVVYLLPNGKVPPAPASQVTKVDQVEKNFVPHVSAMQAGGSVNFPNFDNIRHHVYSFSPARKFEIPLYEGVPTDPVQFPEPGVIALGCNIHDWMSGYIFVAESPWFAITGEDGRALIEDVPAGSYDIEAWHEKLHGDPKKTRQKVQVAATDNATASFKIRQKKVFSAFRGAASRGGGYR